jgi:hypothetical protein
MNAVSKYELGRALGATGKQDKHGENRYWYKRQLHRAIEAAGGFDEAVLRGYDDEVLS